MRILSNSIISATYSGAWLEIHLSQFKGRPLGPAFLV